jgi:hypothetical protein
LKAEFLAQTDHSVAIARLSCPQALLSGAIHRLDYLLCWKYQMQARGAPSDG